MYAGRVRAGPGPAPHVCLQPSICTSRHLQHIAASRRAWRSLPGTPSLPHHSSSVLQIATATPNDADSVDVASSSQTHAELVVEASPSPRETAQESAQPADAPPTGLLAKIIDNNLGKRVASGIVLGLLAGAIVITGKWAYFALMAAFVFQVTQEYYSFMASKGMSKGNAPPPKWVSIATTALSLSIMFVTAFTGGRSGLALTGAAFALLVLLVIGMKKPKFSQLTSSVFGLFYCGECSSAAPAISSHCHPLRFPVAPSAAATRALWTADARLGALYACSHVGWHLLSNVVVCPFFDLGIPLHLSTDALPPPARPQASSPPSG